MQAEVADNRTPVWSVTLLRQQKELNNDDLDLDERTDSAVGIHVAIVMRACDFRLLRPVMQRSIARHLTNTGPQH